jgi:hypothetical protein
LLIEEFENVIFPSTDSRINKIVSIIRGFAHWRINFQEMRPAQILELLSHDFAGNGRIIVKFFQDAAAAPKVMAARTLLSRSAASKVSCPPKECPAIAVRCESIEGRLFKNVKPARTSSR